MSQAYEYEVQSYYPAYGWEAVFIANTKTEADEILKDYRSNQPATPHRVRRVVAEVTA